jgi:uncharacterized protein YfaS (alpha-2-macroglobulin family)
MKRSNRLATLGFSLAFLAAGITLVLVTDSAARQSRADRWKKVDEAIRKGLPKSAIAELEPIIESALKEKVYPEAIKAIGKKIALEGTIQGNKPEEKITRMQAAIATAPAEMHPVMNAILAHWYWHYFQQNRWRFVQRTATGEAPGNDLTTWDLPRILAEIDKHFDKALAAEKELKATPIAAYDALLDKGTVPDTYRPTLWDFLAFEALGFYTAPEQAGAKAQDAFEFTADDPALAPAAEFLKWQPATTDAGSRTLKAVKLFQKVLDFHKGDADKSAFLDADLHRLRFAYNKAVGEGKNEAYVAALKAIAEANTRHELSAMARAMWAGVLRTEEKLVEAREVALAGTQAFPDSTGGKLCHNLVRQIEAKESNIATERVWANPLPTIKVTYRNLTKVHVRVVPADFTDRLKKGRWRPEYLDQNEQQVILRQNPVAAFSHDLPPTPDYKTRTEAIPAPANLKPGFYYVIASHDPGFGVENNHVAYADFWVADLAIVTRNDWGVIQVEGLVTTATSGEPVEGAKVQVWLRSNTGQWSTGASGATDKNGLYSLPGKEQHTSLVIVSHNGRQLASAHDYFMYRPHTTNAPNEQTIFFTDRSLYRPGQTIQFKGICISYQQEKDNYATIPNRAVTVILADANHKEVARQQVRTNDYGSFSGSFTAPRDRLTGRMTIHTATVPQGQTQVSVEEYKRPKFQVTVEAPKEPAKLNAEVKVPGKATAYTGVPIGGAKVSFRVTREVRYPAWFHEYMWWRPVPTRPAQEIAHGTAVTEADGSFTVAFTAKPDRSVPEKDEPSFKYTVTADVTDTTGETRSGSKSVEVGYAALRATVSADSWQTEGAEIKLTVSTTTLDGEGQAAKGTLKVYQLKQPEKVARAELDSSQPWQWRGNRAPKPDPSQPVSWELGEVAFNTDFATDGTGKATVTAKLPAGVYRAIVETKDKFDKAVTAKAQLQVLNPAADRLNIKLPSVVTSPKWSVEPGETFTLLWGSGYDAARAFVEVEHRGQVTQAFWTDPAKTQHVLKVPVTEAMRGGFTVRVSQVRENRAYLTSHTVDVPWSNKNLTLKWERFVSKLEPGKKETFTAVITGPNANRAVAEMVAALYDASLDAFLPHHWMQRFGVFRHDVSRRNSQFENVVKPFTHLHGRWPTDFKQVALRYRSFPPDIAQNLRGYQFGDRGGFAGRNMDGSFTGDALGLQGIPDATDLRLMSATAAAPGARFGGGLPGPAGPAAPMTPAAFEEAGADKRANAALGEPAGPGPDLDAIAARKNLNETAFFFPHLVSDAEGTVRMEFAMPEALTKWKFLGFAHDRELRSGSLTGEVVTAKDLMAQPNPPRFLREGDNIEFPVKLSNQSATRQQGTVRISLKDARTDRELGGDFGLNASEQPFDLPAGESKTVAWRLSVPDGVGPITYKVVAASDRLSDGEEGVLPVLSKRVLVTESLSLPIRGAGTKQFEFVKLRDSAKSDTIRSQSYTVQMVSQPAWYAVMALPYLMEYPHECSEQVFNRLYANSLARHIAGSDPKIRKIFDLWKNTPALDSPLEKNQDLKGVLLDETPWVRQAVAEGQARKNVGVLFDDNRLNEEIGRVTAKLAQMQNADGGWPWFPGGRTNDYITLYITTGYGRLRHLGVKIDTAPAVRALTHLDGWADERYQWILKHGNPDANHLSPVIALYLYGRSFFLQDRPVAQQHRAAVDYWQTQAKKFWLQLAHRQSQAHLAVALKRFGDKQTPAGIMASIKERSVSNEEMGMFWRDLELSYSWFRAPIETQAMMVEAFDEVMNDAQAVEDCKVWLLKQKQTQDWKTTKATADAVYALLLRGDNLLKSDALVEVSLAGQTIKPEKVEAGTGFYEHRFVRGEVNPSLAAISVKKTDPGVSWGSVHWQYLEDIAKVTPHDGTPLKVEKSLFKRTFAKTGPVLNPFGKDALGVGDEVVVRVVLRTDRDMEYVHLKDHRGSGTEPVNVLSRYRFQDGLAYYESTKDTASHFFIDYLPKGTYVFEYPVRVQLRGHYTTGFANVECMYAPEFNSHSESIPLEVK